MTTKIVSISGTRAAVTFSRMHRPKPHSILRTGIEVSLQLCCHSEYHSPNAFTFPTFLSSCAQFHFKHLYKFDKVLGICRSFGKTCGGHFSIVHKSTSNLVFHSNEQMCNVKICHTKLSQRLTQDNVWCLFNAGLLAVVRSKYQNTVGQVDPTTSLCLVDLSFQLETKKYPANELHLILTKVLVCTKYEVISKSPVSQHVHATGDVLVGIA